MTARSKQCEPSSLGSRFVPRTWLSVFPFYFLSLTSFTFASSSLSLSSFVSSEHGRRRRQAVWLVLGSPSRYYHIRYKIRNPNTPSRRAFYRESTSHRVDAVVIPLGQRRLVLLACSILAINFFLLPSSSRSLPVFLAFSPSLSPSSRLHYVVSAAGSLASLLFSG